MSVVIRWIGLGEGDPNTAVAITRCRWSQVNRPPAANVDTCWAGLVALNARRIAHG